MVQKESWKVRREYLDHKNPERFTYKAEPGLSEEIVRFISKQKNEPEWMLEKRLKGLELWNKLPMPEWGPDISALDINNITFYHDPDSKKNATKWEDLPEDIRRTFEKLGIPEAERKSLGGAGVQYESMVVYHSLKKDLEKKGVVFLDMDEGVKQYPDLVKEHFMTSCVPVGLHKFAALHAAVWSGGTFIYVPPGVKVPMPLQAYFRMNAEKGGQFEHTLIIVDKGAEVQYVEGCSAPQYDSKSLHAGCVEVHVKEGARARYSSVENWSKNTFNLNTKRSVVEKNAIMEWVNGNMGCLTGDSKVYTNPRGPVAIRDIKPGSHVFTLNEKNKKFVKARVKNMIYSGKKSVYNLQVAGREIKASANHPFLVLRHEKIPRNKKKGRFITQWEPLEKLKKGDLIAISKSLPDAGKSYKLPIVDTTKRKTTSKNQYKDFEMRTSYLYGDLSFPKNTNEDLMWFFGIYLGDGNLWRPKKGGAKINIAIHEKEDLRKPLLDIVQKIFNYTVKYKKDRFIIINSNILAELIEKLGFSGTAKTKRVPDWVFSLPKSQRLAFLAGLIDSDGHIGKGGLYLTSISKALLEDVKALAISCGFGVSRIFVHGKERETIILGNKTHANDSFRILLNGRKVKSLPTKSKRYSEKLKNVTTWRNFSRAHGWNFHSKTSEDLGFARIDSITPLGIEPTYDIEVEGHHNFVSNGIVVHNSCVTMLYPSTVLKGANSRGDYLGIAFAGKDQHQDTGTKVYHLAPNTQSVVRAKSISMDGGISTYRGLLQINKGCTGATSSVSCDALLLDEKSVTNTFPFMKVNEQRADVAHEATVGKISADQVFYLMSRGLTEEQAMKLIVQGFMEPIVKELPLEYAVELNRLIELEMEGAIG